MNTRQVDRLSPARRPSGNPSGYQTWRELLFVHWTYPLELVRPLVPPELELDAWNGRAYVGAVPFVMKDIRLSGLPRWSAMDFLETNLRTYVIHKGEPGVFFFSLEASSRLAVRAARWGWGLPYFDAQMTLNREAGGVIDYRTTRTHHGARLNVRFRPGAALGPSAPDTLQHFLLERYFLFNLRKGAVWKGHVHHVPYPARECEVLSIDESLTRGAGLPASSGAPETVHFSDGVEVEVFGPHRL
jgi:hypothetical protein